MQVLRSRWSIGRGDNRDILRRYLPETCVDLVYLDPPFNANRDDVIFRDESGRLLDLKD